MRRMYSKEQLQKLIDEVSRLIAIEELDKVVPVPSLATAGYIMQVNAAGTGYQLKDIDELQVPIYCHPIYLYIRDSLDSENYCAGCMLILDNTATAYNEITLKAKLKALMDAGAYINYNGVARNSLEGAFGPSIMFLKSGSNYELLFGAADGSSIYSLNTDLEGSTLIWHVSDGVNKIN